jgi:hypothetical protein
MAWCTGANLPLSESRKFLKNILHLKMKTFKLLSVIHSEHMPEGMKMRLLVINSDRAFRAGPSGRTV